MTQSTDLRVILAALETTYGTDAVPTGTDAVLIAGAPNLTPIAGNLQDRNLMKGYSGADGSLIIGKHTMIEFAVRPRDSSTEKKSRSRSST